MPSITIRKATPGDIPVLISFQQALARETESLELDPTIVKEGMMQMFRDPAKGLYFVAEISNEIAGCHMITYEWSDWRNGVIWWLQSVYVREQFRKLGVFRAMFDNLMKEVKTNPGVKGLRLYVEKSNVRAQKVYAAMGMNGDHYSVFEWIKN